MFCSQRGNLFAFLALLAATGISGNEGPAAKLTSNSAASSNPAATQTNGALGNSMPSWWKLSLEIRGRADSYGGLSGVAGWDDHYYLHRLRLNSAFTVRPWLKLFVQLQDSRVADYDRLPTPATIRNPVDLRQAYVDVGIAGEQRWALRVGRQPLVFGDMRLVSTSNWSNVGPAYDGVRLTHAIGAARLDWFAVQVVQPQAGFDRPRSDRKLAGYYGTLPVGKAGRTLDTYLIWKGNRYALSEDRRPGGLDVYTVGTRSAGKLVGSFDYNVELALQRGHISEDDLAAWSLHTEVGHKRRVARGDMRLWFEHNYASGDRQAGDGRRQTFEQYYPSPWSVVARAAEFASRNLHEPLAGLQWQATRKWRFRGTMRAFWLARREDALYTLSGAVYARRPDSLEKRVGEELGLWAICDARRGLQLWGGYARLFPGPFLKNAGKSSPTNYFFFVWTLTLD
jgi:hypothetical protein